jgi:hypothetical protein
MGILLYRKQRTKLFITCSTLYQCSTMGNVSLFIDGTKSSQKFSIKIFIFKFHAQRTTMHMHFAHMT